MPYVKFTAVAVGRRVGEASPRPEPGSSRSFARRALLRLARSTLYILADVPCQTHAIASCGPIEVPEANTITECRNKAFPKWQVRFDATTVTRPSRSRPSPASLPHFERPPHSQRHIATHLKHRQVHFTRLKNEGLYNDA